MFYFSVVKDVVLLMLGIYVGIVVVVFLLIVLFVVCFFLFYYCRRGKLFFIEFIMIISYGNLYEDIFMVW